MLFNLLNVEHERVKDIWGRYRDRITTTAEELRDRGRRNSMVEKECVRKKFKKQETYQMLLP